MLALRNDSLLGQRDFKMRHAALVAERTAHRRRTNTLQPRSIVGYRALHVEAIDIDIETLFVAYVRCILQRRTQQLFDGWGHCLLGEGQGIQCIFDLPALDQIQHQARLLRRHTLKASLGFKFLGCKLHNLFLFLSGHSIGMAAFTWLPAWPQLPPPPSSSVP